MNSHRLTYTCHMDWKISSQFHMHVNICTQSCTLKHTEGEKENRVSFTNILLFILQNFYKDINREAMYIRYLHTGSILFHMVPVYAVRTCICASGRVHTSVWLHNLTRDYKSSTELMSKSMGSAVSLTGAGGGGGEKERQRLVWGRHGGRQDGRTAGETGGAA